MSDNIFSSSLNALFPPKETSHYVFSSGCSCRGIVCANAIHNITYQFKF